MLFKEIVDARTDARTDGRWTPDIDGSQKLTEHFVLRWAKKYNISKEIKAENANQSLQLMFWFQTNSWKACHTARQL